MKVVLMPLLMLKSDAFSCLPKRFKKKQQYAQPLLSYLCANVWMAQGPNA